MLPRSEQNYGESSLPENDTFRVIEDRLNDLHRQAGELEVRIAQSEGEDKSHAQQELSQINAEIYGLAAEKNKLLGL